MVTCGMVMEAMEHIAPRRLAEEWDNPGLLLGSPEQEIRKILVCLDVSDAAVERGVSLGVDMLLSHHPLIFKPLKKIRTDLPLGRRLQALLKHDIAVFSAHTNLDIARGGVNDILAERIGLAEREPLVEACRDEQGREGMGRIGRLASPVEFQEFALRVKEALGVEHIRVVPAGDRMVSKVALCGGSGAEFIGKAAALGADVYVTGDVKYHDAQHAAEMGVHVIDAGHFGTEFPVVPVLRNLLEKELAERGKSVEILAYEEAEDFFETL